MLTTLSFLMCLSVHDRLIWSWVCVKLRFVAECLHVSSNESFGARWSSPGQPTSWWWVNTTRRWWVGPEASQLLILNISTREEEEMCIKTLFSCKNIPSFLYIEEICLFILHVRSPWHPDTLITVWTPLLDVPPVYSFILFIVLQTICHSLMQQNDITELLN